MTPEKSLTVVRNYYLAYQAESAAKLAEALQVVLNVTFTLENPFVEAQFGGPASGETALVAAAGVAPFLRNAEIESL